MQDVLARHMDSKVRVFAVWEPILFTDWGKPGSRSLDRFSDPRVSQIWDPQHVVARQLAKDARLPQPEPECCLRNDILWDLAAIYPPGALWTDAMPQAVFFDGPVAPHRAQIEAALLRK